MSNYQLYKKNLAPSLGLTGLNNAQNEVFRYFLEFGSKVFPEFEYDDSLRQCLTSSRSKTHGKNSEGPDFDQAGQNQTRNQVFCHFLKFASLVFLDIARDCRLGQCLTSSRGATSKKIWWPKGQKNPNRGQNEVSQHFLSSFLKEERSY